ncbi:Hypothetical predicted protein [Octopus vulgaris]|uniref:Uncharacterized protein n=1 Tax=Octopus vulgaris TaxID=6645 RepID=A0AA36B559_OCTVU|nr:Hypothetical predicted protein [Octopus vulgaris]
MGRKCDLTASEKSRITSEFSKGKSTLEISKVVERYHETEKKLLQFLRRYGIMIWTGIMAGLEKAPTDA